MGNENGRYLLADTQDAEEAARQIPAFARSGWFINNDYFAEEQAGMDLLDWWAGHSIPAAVAMMQENGEVLHEEGIANTAYNIASAMAAERFERGKAYRAASGEG